MNTADRSLSLVDYALRRRFAFVNLEPMFHAQSFRDALLMKGVPDSMVTQIAARMGELNDAISSDLVNLGPGFQIGHSFFTPTQEITDTETWYRRVVETEIHPLLEEYWFDDPTQAEQWSDQLLTVVQ